MSRVLTTCRLSPQTLKEWVAVESDSVQPVLRLRRELLRMMGLAAERLRLLGARVDSVDAGFQQVLASPPPPSCRLPGHEPGFPSWRQDGALLAPVLRSSTATPSKGENRHLIPPEAAASTSRPGGTGGDGGKVEGAREGPHLCCSCPSRASRFSQMALSLKLKCLFLEGPNPSSESRLITAPQE